MYAHMYANSRVGLLLLLTSVKTGKQVSNVHRLLKKDMQDTRAKNVMKNRITLSSEHKLMIHYF